MSDIFSIQHKSNAKSVQLKSQIVCFAIKVYVFNVHMDIQFHQQAIHAFHVQPFRAVINV
jgi:hypothetical protein